MKKKKKKAEIELGDIVLVVSCCSIQDGVYIAGNDVSDYKEDKEK